MTFLRHAVCSTTLSIQKCVNNNILIAVCVFVEMEYCSSSLSIVYSYRCQALHSLYKKGSFLREYKIPFCV